jgi:hypothetical protein
VEFDQNLNLLDEATIFRFFFFSVFNPDAIKDLKLYKGGIPATYGSVHHLFGIFIKR